MNALPAGAIDWCALSEDEPVWRDPREGAYRKLRAEWQAEAEERCERSVVESLRGAAPAAVDDEVARLAALGSVTLEGLPLEVLAPLALDREVRELARRIAAQDLELARGLLELHEANGWRRLGYASEAQYARERLGVSVSRAHPLGHRQGAAARRRRERADGGVKAVHPRRAAPGVPRQGAARSVTSST